MAVVQFVFTKAGQGNVQAYVSGIDAQETETSSGTVANTTATAPDGDCVCRIKVDSGSVYVAVGVEAVASSTNGYLMVGPDTLDLVNVPKGARGSVIDA